MLLASYFLYFWLWTWTFFIEWVCKNLLTRMFNLSSILGLKIKPWKAVVALLCSTLWAWVCPWAGSRFVSCCVSGYVPSDPEESIASMSVTKVKQAQLIEAQYQITSHAFVNLLINVRLLQRCNDSIRALIGKEKIRLQGDLFARI